MNWYNCIKKTSSSNNYPTVKQLKIAPVGNGQKVQINFIMQGGASTFVITTRNPVDVNSFNKNDPAGTFEQQKMSGNLTTSKAESERKALQNQSVDQNIQNKPQEESTISGYASRRSILIHKQSRVNKMKGGKGDKLDVKDVNKEELIRGIEIELEHVGEGLDISKESIRQFVENQLNGEKEEIKHEDILKTSQDIALDHLEEMDDYYTRLDKMEQEAEK